MNDDLLALASAYLADDVTDDERARVESDPDTMAIVDELRAVSRALADVEPPADPVREQAIAAALAAWDAMPGTETPSTDDAARGPATAPIPIRRRPRMSRALSIAAACVAVAALGTVVVNGLRSSGDDDATFTADEPAAMPSEQLESAPTARDMADDSDLAGDADMPDSDMPEVFADDAADGGLDPAGEAGTMADTTDAPEATITATAEPIPEVADADELAELVRRLLDDERLAGDSPDDETTSAPPADGEVLTCEGLVARELGDAVYAGLPVVIGVDADVSRARAIDPSDCSLVADVPLDAEAG